MMKKIILNIPSIDPRFPFSPIMRVPHIISRVDPTDILLLPPKYQILQSKLVPQNMHTDLSIMTQLLLLIFNAI